MSEELSQPNGPGSSLQNSLCSEKIRPPEKNQWTAVRFASAVIFSTAAPSWVFLGCCYAIKSLRAREEGEYMKSRYWAVQTMVATLIASLATLITAFSTVDYLFLAYKKHLISLQWIYIYGLIGLHNFLHYVSRYSTGPPQFTTLIFHTNLNAMLGFPLSRMLAGWGLMAPMYIYFDVVQWTTEAAAATIVVAPVSNSSSGSGANLMHETGCMGGGTVTTFAVVQRCVALGLTSLTCMVLVQLAFGSVPQPHDTVLKVPTTAAEPSSLQHSSPTDSSSKSSYSQSFATYTTAAVASLTDRMDDLDMHFNALRCRILPSLPLGLMVLVACLPYALYMFVNVFTRLILYGDRDPKSQVQPIQVLLVMLTFVMVGRTDMHDALRRMLQAEDLLCDLVPKHVADALLSTMQRQRRRYKEQRHLLSSAVQCPLGRGSAEGEGSGPDAKELKQGGQQPPKGQPLTAAVTVAVPVTLRPGTHELQPQVLEKQPRQPPLPQQQQQQPQEQQPQQQQLCKENNEPCLYDGMMPSTVGQRTVKKCEEMTQHDSNSVVSQMYSSLVSAMTTATGSAVPPLGMRSRQTSLTGIAVAPLGDDGNSRGDKMHSEEEDEDEDELEMVDDGPDIAEWHQGVTVLFADIRGFTEMSQKVEPLSVMRFLNSLYHRFDRITSTIPGIYKVETIGDCYMVASGLIVPNDDHAAAMLRFAAAMLRAAATVPLPHTGEPVKIRIGVHSGRVMSGVVGSIRKRYCLFGDTVNIASRLETTSQPGRIHISSETHALAMRSSSAVQSEFDFEAREPIDVGKGIMQTFFANPLPPQQVQTPPSSTHIGACLHQQARTSGGKPIQACEGPRSTDEVIVGDRCTAVVDS